MGRKEFPEKQRHGEHCVMGETWHWPFGCVWSRDVQVESEQSVM